MALISEAARGRLTPPPMLAPQQQTGHGPTIELLAALRANDWRVKWHEGGRAALVHRDYGSMEVELAEEMPDRLRTFVDGRQVPHRIAMDRAEGVA